MWPNSTFRFWISWFFWHCGFSWTSLVFSRHHCHRFPCAVGFLLPIQRVLIRVRCHKFPCAEEQLSTSLPSLRTRRCVGIEFWFVLASGLPDNPTCRLEPLSIPGHLDAIGLFTDAGSSPLAWISPQSCYLLIVLASFSPSSWCSWTSWNSWRNRESWNGWCWTNKEDFFHSSRVKLPLVKMSASWGLVSLYRIWIWESRLVLSNTQFKSNSVGYWHMSHLWTPAFDYHLHHGFIVLKHVQHRNRMHIINMTQFQNYRAWQEIWFCSSFVCLSWRDAHRFPCADGPLVLSGWFWSQWQTSTAKFQRSKAGIPSIRRPAFKRNYFSFRWTYEKLKSVFLHIQLLDTNVWLPKMNKISPDVDFESPKSPAKIRILQES